MIDHLEFKELIDFAWGAHQEQAKADASTTRPEGVPFTAHPLWCALMVLNDASLPTRVRRLGFQALLLHDVLEDTTAALPPGLDPEVIRLVRDMTYDSWEDEMREVPQKDSLVKLLKVVDKVATLYDDGVRATKRAEWIQFTQGLIDDVEGEFGGSVVIAVAKKIVERTG